MGQASSASTRSSAPAPDWESQFSGCKEWICVDNEYWISFDDAIEVCTSPPCGWSHEDRIPSYKGIVDLLYIGGPNYNLAFWCERLRKTFLLHSDKRAVIVYDRLFTRQWTLVESSEWLPARYTVSVLGRRRQVLVSGRVFQDCRRVTCDGPLKADACVPVDAKIHGDVGKRMLFWKQHRVLLPDSHQVFLFREPGLFRTMMAVDCGGRQELVHSQYVPWNPANSVSLFNEKELGFQFAADKLVVWNGLLLVDALGKFKEVDGSRFPEHNTRLVRLADDSHFLVDTSVTELPDLQSDIVLRLVFTPVVGILPTYRPTHPVLQCTSLLACYAAFDHVLGPGLQELGLYTREAHDLPPFPAPETSAERLLDLQFLNGVYKQVVCTQDLLRIVPIGRKLLRHDYSCRTLYALQHQDASEPLSLDSCDSLFVFDDTKDMSTFRYCPKDQSFWHVGLDKSVRRTMPEYIRWEMMLPKRVVLVNNRSVTIWQVPETDLYINTNFVDGLDDCIVCSAEEAAMCRHDIRISVHV